MKLFSDLIRQLDETNKTNEKLALLSSYFDKAPDKDKIWTIAILSHRRPARPVKTSLLRDWAAELAGIEPWLFEESYHYVGDLAETISLLVSWTGNDISPQTLEAYIQEIIQLKKMDEPDQKATLFKIWASLDYYSCFVFNKLMTGGFRIGVSQKLMTKALAMSTGIDAAVLAHRIMGNWDPSVESFSTLILEGNGKDDLARPYPFHLAYPIDVDVYELGDPENWTAEWKWDGIRGQLICREQEIFLWSRGEELVTHQFPEFETVHEYVSDTFVLDGEVLAYSDGSPMEFNTLQRRLGRKKPGAKIMREVPVCFMAYDLLELNKEDLRGQNFSKRRALLESLCMKFSHPAIMISPLIPFNDWKELTDHRARSRAEKAEGVMLKSTSGHYHSGRVRGDMWKWKVDPYTIDAVLTYATRGHGRRSNLYTDYTFGLWKEGELITFAKAYSGLTDEAFREVDRFVRQNTLDRFGPVRQVAPELVFELAFEGVARSNRHKSGIATRFPRIKRWRKDKKASEANHLDDILQMLDFDQA